MKRFVCPLCAGGSVRARSCDEQSEQYVPYGLSVCRNSAERCIAKFVLMQAPQFTFRVFICLSWSPYTRRHYSSVQKSLNVGRCFLVKQAIMSSSSGIQIPGRLPLLLTHEGVLLPGATMRISVDTARNMQLVKSRLLKGTSLKSTIIGVIPNTRDPDHDSEELPTLHRCHS